MGNNRSARRKKKTVPGRKCFGARRFNVSSNPFSSLLKLRLVLEPRGGERVEVDARLCVFLSCGEVAAGTERPQAVFENIFQTNVKYGFRLLCSKVTLTFGAPSAALFKLPLRDKSALLPYMFSVAASGAVSLALMVSTLPA